jgi:hypothetical protein
VERIFRPAKIWLRSCLQPGDADLVSSSCATLQTVSLCAERGETTVNELAVALGLAPSTAQCVVEDCRACGTAMLEIFVLVSRT